MSSPALGDADRGPTPAVSIIIPAYGVTAFISEAIESVLAQTFTNFEIIVVNDGCPDSPCLEAALEPYRARIVYIRKDNGGVSAARNAALRVARAPLVALLDGDDAWRPDYLETQVNVLRNDQTADVVYPNGTVFGDTPLAGRELMELSPSDGLVTFTSLINLRCSVTVSVMARTEMFRRVGGFDETLRRAEDFDLWLRITKAGGRIIFHREHLFRYRGRDRSLSADRIAMRQDGLLVLEKAAKTLPLSVDERIALERAQLRFTADIAYFSAREAIARGDTAEAIAAYRRLGSLRWSVKNALTIVLLRFLPRLALRLANR